METIVQKQQQKNITRVADFGKLGASVIQNLKRGTPEWTEFESWQGKRIERSLEKYDNPESKNIKFSESEIIDGIHLQRKHIVDTESQLRASLERIKNKTYGSCVNCRGTIPAQRLIAAPTAQICIKC